MRILIAAGIYPPDAGGPAIHAKRQFEGFGQIGIKTRLVALAHYRKWPKLLRHWVYLAVLMCKAIGSEVIYAHDAVGVGVPASIVAKLLGKKFVLRIGGDLAWERDVKGSTVPLLEWYKSGAYIQSRFYKLSSQSLKKADKIIVPSQLLAKLYVEYYGISEDKIEVIPNPLPEAKEFEIKTNQTIIYASRLVGYKNLNLVFKVLARIFPKHPDLSFIVMGDGPEREPLEQLSRDLGIAGHVVFKGDVPHDEVLRETASALFTLAPAVTEFNPNYVLQGLSYSKPFVISTDNGLPFSVPEYLSFKYDDEQALFDRIEHLLTKEGYEEAVNFVRTIDFKMTWEENLKLNVVLVLLLLNGSK